MKDIEATDRKNVPRFKVVWCCIGVVYHVEKHSNTRVVEAHS
jgi:hypothetical protein